MSSIDVMANYAHWYARQLLRVGHHLWKSYRDIAVPTNQSRKESATANACGTVLSGALLMAFATEIALKALRMQETRMQIRRDEKTHNLLDIFDTLQTDTQQLMEARFDLARSSAATNVPLREILNRHARTFSDTRYIFERAHSEITDIDKLYVAAKTIVEFYGSVYPYADLVPSV